MGACYYGTQPKPSILSKKHVYTILSMYSQQSGELKVSCKNILHSCSCIMGGTEFFIVA